MFNFVITNWMGLVVAVIAAMAIGAVWYSKILFGKQWMEYAKIKEKDMKGASAAKAYAIMVVVSAVSAIVLMRFLVIANPQDIGQALKVGGWLWLGFVAPFVISATAFEKRPWGLAVIYLGNQLVTILAMTAILYYINLA
jgi:hypothetical protein